MPVNIGGGPEHGFDEPLGLLSDCHRRIERFLGVLARVAGDARGGALNGEQRKALDIALRYFREAAPKHTADEEESLFPRMRACAGREAEQALDRVAALEADHRRAEQLHAEVEALFNAWRDQGRLTSGPDARLRDAIEELQQIYGDHIRTEDEYVFPLAGRALDREAQLAIGREMAERRGVLPGVASDIVAADKLR